MEEKILFTSESVSEGHPDKVCDQISDAILDAVLKEDKDSFVACECFATTDFLLIGGEITTKAEIDYEKVAREVIKDIGYDKDELGFNYKTVKIFNAIKTQSPDIRQGVYNDNPLMYGAGDQGIMFGYASNESEGYMPLAICIAHKLVRIATQNRKFGAFKWARPDMKSEVTIDYSEKTPKIKTILMSVQHDPDYDEASFKNYIKEEIMKKVAKSFGLNTDFEVLINPTGRFVLGGPAGDTGLTGRKIIVDTYGGIAKHGGGAFSGKDGTKTDRSGAYFARYIAKNIVASGLCDRCEIQLAFAIGVNKPIAFYIDTFNTNKISESKIYEIVKRVFNNSVSEIINMLDLRKPIYKNLATYGHFGRDDLNVKWEQLDKVEIIKDLITKI